MVKPPDAIIEDTGEPVNVTKFCSPDMSFRERYHSGRGILIIRTTGQSPSWQRTLRFGMDAFEQRYGMEANTVLVNDRDARFLVPIPGLAMRARLDVPHNYLFYCMEAVDVHPCPTCGKPTENDTHCDDCLEIMDFDDLL